MISSLRFFCSISSFKVLPLTRHIAIEMQKIYSFRSMIKNFFAQRNVELMAEILLLILHLATSMTFSAMAVLCHFGAIKNFLIFPSPGSWDP